MYLLNHKFEAINKFEEFRLETENQLGRRIKMLRSYHDSEYFSTKFLDYLKENGILS